MLTPDEKCQFDKFLQANGISYWFTDEARRQVLESAQAQPWSIDVCMRRLTKLKEDVVTSGDVGLVAKFFEQLREYEKQIGPNGIPKGPAVVALAEENMIRIYKLWFKHFDDWFTELVTHEEMKESDYAF